jgi:hypothetical protein
MSLLRRRAVVAFAAAALSTGGVIASGGPARADVPRTQCTSATGNNFYSEIWFSGCQTLQAPQSGWYPFFVDDLFITDQKHYYNDQAACMVVTPNGSGKFFGQTCSWQVK